jgi:hypothetical protein
MYHDNKSCIAVVLGLILGVLDLREEKTVDMLPQLLELPWLHRAAYGHSSVVPLLGHTYVGSDHYIGVVDAIVSRFFLFFMVCSPPGLDSHKFQKMHM